MPTPPILSSPSSCSLFQQQRLVSLISMSRPLPSSNSNTNPKLASKASLLTLIVNSKNQFAKECIQRKKKVSTSLVELTRERNNKKMIQSILTRSEKKITERNSHLRRFFRMQTERSGVCYCLLRKTNAVEYMREPKCMEALLFFLCFYFLSPEATFLLYLKKKSSLFFSLARSFPSMYILLVSFYDFF